jgi:hypothetical protein
VVGAARLKRQPSRSIVEADHHDDATNPVRDSAADCCDQSMFLNDTLRQSGQITVPSGTSTMRAHRQHNFLISVGMMMRSGSRVPHAHGDPIERERGAVEERQADRERDDHTE